MLIYIPKGWPGPIIVAVVILQIIDTLEGDVAANLKYFLFSYVRKLKQII